MGSTHWASNDRPDAATLFINISLPFLHFSHEDKQKNYVCMRTVMNINASRVLTTLEASV